MPHAPAVDLPIMSSSSTSGPCSRGGSSSREIAENEDIYFGGDHPRDAAAINVELHHPPEHHEQQHLAEGFLDQALQMPSSSNLSWDSDNAIHPNNNNNNFTNSAAAEDDRDGSSSENYFESLTPTFVTRKHPDVSSSQQQQRRRLQEYSASSSNGGHRTPIHQNDASTNSNNVLHRHHYDPKHEHPSDPPRRISTDTTLGVDNRGGEAAAIGDGGYQPHDHVTATRTSSGSNSNISSLASSSQQHYQDPSCMSRRSSQSEDSSQLNQRHQHQMIIPQSVDTVPTSNVATLQEYQRDHFQQSKQRHNNLRQARTKSNCNTISPPRLLVRKEFHANSEESGSTAATQRRSVFGRRVQQRYPTANRRQDQQLPQPAPPADPAPFYNIIEDGKHITFQQQVPQPPNWVATDDANANAAKAEHDPAPYAAADPVSDHPPPPLTMVITHDDDSPAEALSSTDSMEDFFTPRNSLNPTVIITNSMGANPASSLVSPLESPPFLVAGTCTPNTSMRPTANKNKQLTAAILASKQMRHRNHQNSKQTNSASKIYHHQQHRIKRIHETVHAQSLLLGLCFMAIWSPNNIMAPNLTRIATFYGMTETERDLYLGSFLALATGVLGFPISAAIGVMTDFYPRKYLFVGTAFGGAMASAATGLSPTYPWLLLARFFSGGFMSASVSVAFSLMGDLFATEERNAASSGLTAMMGLGIILGQVYAGIFGNSRGWQNGFWVSSGVTVVLGLCVAVWVQEPVRGGKEKVLQDLLQQGKRYDRKLTWAGFKNAMSNNRSNAILMTQGFFSSLPFGILFVFFNDYLSQERGFSVPDATFIVLVFGIGCAVGGILGGYLGAWIQSINRSFLPLFMAATTLIGVVPFFALLNGHTTNARGYWCILYAFTGGCFSSMPSVNVRPCLINVNPPETRGASLTAANLIINLARGLGPSCITLLGSSFDLSRQESFNITLGVFWTLAAIQLCYLANALPQDQDKMEAELAHYAASALASTTSIKPSIDGTDHSALMISDQYSLEPNRPDSSKTLDDDVSLLSIEDRMTTFDGVAVQESLSFFQKGMKELNFPPLCAGTTGDSSFDDEDDFISEDDVEVFNDEERQRQQEARKLLSTRDAGDDTMSPVDLLKRRNLWLQQQQKMYGATNTNDGVGYNNGEEANTGSRKEEKPPTETSRLF